MSQKSSFLKGLIFKEDATAKTPAAASTATSSSVTTVPTSVSPTVSVQGVVDNKFVDMLEGVIKQNNIPGQDYFEFKEAVENMKSLPMDEKTKFQTVHSVLSLQGCKKEILLSSIDNYIGVINKEKASFDAEMKAAYAQKVQSKLNEVDKAKKELESFSKKLAELNSTIQTLSQEAQQEEMQIRATESNFKASADVIISEMVSDKDKINNYIA
jgi:hypothetical protein